MDMKLAILEGKWFEDKNVTVEDLFHMLGDLTFKEAHPYYYHMFDDKNTFSDLINDVFRKKELKYLYVAAHGTNNGIYGTNDDVISRTTIKNALNRVREPKDGGVYGSNIEGAFFGSCNFMTLNNAKYLLNSTDLKWVAGYSEEIDWIESSMIDLIFWQMFIRNKESKPIKKIQKVCDTFWKRMPIWVEEFGFNVYIRKKGIKKDIISCFAELHEMIEDISNSGE